jgi:hypothetical protein
MTLILLNLDECCFAGTVLILGASEGSAPSAPKLKVGRETPRVGCSLVKGWRRIMWCASEAQFCRGGVVVRFVAEGAAWAVVLARSDGAPRQVSMPGV